MSDSREHDLVGPESGASPVEGIMLTPSIRAWRLRALWALLVIVSVAGLPAYLVPLLNAYRQGRLTPILWAYLGVYLAFVALAFAPALPYRTRAWGLVVLGFANGIASMARLGLAGSGRLYLLVMPVVAALLLGERAGYLAAAASLLVYGSFAALAGSGRLTALLTVPASPADLSSWIEAGIALAVFLLALIVLVVRFYRFLLRTLVAQQRASSDLAATARALSEREERLTRQNATLAALHQTAVGLAAAQTAEALLEDLVQRSVRLVGAAYGWLYLVDEQRGDLVAAVGTGYFERYVGVRLKRGEGLSGRIWAEGCALSIDNYRFWEGRSDHFKGDPIGPAIGVPLHHEGKVVGVIGLTRTLYSRPFTPDDVEAIEQLAELAAIALANARLHAARQNELAARVEAQAALEIAYQDLERRVQERTRQLATLNAVAAAASGTLELRAVMQEALDKTIESTGMELGLAYRLERNQDRGGWDLLVTAQRGLPDGLLGRIAALSLGDTMLEQAPAIGRPIIWGTGDFPECKLHQALARAGLQNGVSVPLISKGELMGALVLTSRAARTVTEEQVALLAGIGAQIGVAADNARLYASERERRREAERSRRVADGMQEIVAALNARQSLSETLDFIVTHACRTLGSDASSIRRQEGTGGPLRVQAVCGLDAGLLAAAESEAHRRAAGLAIADRRPIVVEERAEPPGTTESPGSDSPVQDVAGSPSQLDQFAAALFVPLFVQGQPDGVLTLYYRDPQSLAGQEIREAQSLADQAALAIESARLREQAFQAAAMSERSRLARELHDSVTQSLYSVTLYAEAAARQLEAGRAGEATAHLRSLGDTAREALREMRLLIFELRPPALEGGGLAAALQARLQAVERRGGVQVDLSIDGEEDLPIPTQQELYHIAREALNNALKHAQAQQVAVRLTYRPGEALMEISDDGIGFDPAAASNVGGMGLANMRERAQRIGATVLLHSRPSQGTVVRVEVPLPVPSQS